MWRRRAASARPPPRRTPRSRPSRAAGQPLELGVAHRGHHHPVVAGEHRQHRQQALLDRGGLERGEQHDQRPLPAELAGPRRPARPSRPRRAPARGRPARPRGGRRRRARRPRRSRVRTRGRRRRSRPGRRRATPAPPAAARPPSPSRGEGRRRRGRPRPGRCRAPAPRAGRARAARCAPRRCGCARGGPPVDGADVVAADVLAQRVELGALAAHPYGGAAVELAQPGQAARQVLAGVEGRHDRTAPGDLEGALPRRRARGDRAAARSPGGARSPRRRGQQGGGQHGAVAGGEPQPVPVAARAGRGLPGVAQHAGDRAPSRCW